MAATLAALGACTTGADPAKGPAAVPAADEPAAIIETPSGTRARVRLEVARTPEETSRGLMYRQSLDADAGMLFVFPDETDHAFWMKNTYISLDILFISSGGEVVYAALRTTPLSTATISAGGPSRYVLEVNAGFCAQNLVSAGSRVTFIGVAGVP